MDNDCPRCGAGGFRRLTISDVDLNQCEGCLGLWFDPGQYERTVTLLRQDGLAEDAATIEEDVASSAPSGVAPAHAYTPVHQPCPGCAAATLQVEPTRFHFTNRFLVIDRCPACQGVWLDVGELRQLHKFLRAEDKALVKAGIDAGAPVGIAGDPMPRRNFLRRFLTLSTGD